MVGIYILTHRKSSRSDKEQADVELTDTSFTTNPLADGSSPVAPPRRESLRPRSRSIDFSVGFASLMATPMPTVDDEDDATAFSLMEEAAIAVDAKPRLSSVSETEVVPDVPAPVGTPRRSLIQGLLSMLPMHGGSGSNGDMTSAMLDNDGVIDDAPLTLPAAAMGGGGGGGSGGSGGSSAAGSTHTSPALHGVKASSSPGGGNAASAASGPHGSPVLTPSHNPNARYHELLSPVGAAAPAAPAVVFAHPRVAPPSPQQQQQQQQQQQPQQQSHTPSQSSTLPSHGAMSHLQLPPHVVLSQPGDGGAAGAAATAPKLLVPVDDDESADFNPF